MKILFFFVALSLSLWLFATEIRAVGINLENLSATIENYVKTLSNTGSNESSGGTIDTGNAGATTVVTNVVNTNVINPCCPTITPAPTPSAAPQPSPTPTPPVTPTPTPPVEPTPTPTSTPPPSGGEGQPPSEGGIGGPPAEGAPPSQGEVLGLAVTSGEGQDAWLFYALGLLCLGLGAKLITGKRFILA